MIIVMKCVDVEVNTKQVISPFELNVNSDHSKGVTSENKNCTLKLLLLCWLLDRGPDRQTEMRLSRI